MFKNRINITFFCIVVCGCSFSAKNDAQVNDDFSEMFVSKYGDIKCRVSDLNEYQICITKDFTDLTDLSYDKKTFTMSLFKYSRSSKNCLMVKFHPNGTVKEILMFDKNGNRIREYGYFENGALEFETKYSNNLKGDCQ